jgi:hypothetical protein
MGVFFKLNSICFFKMVLGPSKTTDIFSCLT